MIFVNKSYKVTDALIHFFERRFTASKITILTVFWYVWVVALPMTMLSIWGIIVMLQQNAPEKAGLGIMFFGNFLLLLLIGLVNWKLGYNWLQTTFTFYALLIGVGSVLAYSFFSTACYFTYSGTTAILMSINYIFAISLTFIRSTKTDDSKQEKYFNLEILL